ncbi:MAG: acyl-CoA thioesterase [Coleofasciculaceae cyanobacterium RL_1_1]|nr:acyl-CoA thioesterase [Coleofasciculaceae cyanobacterium RL_1_1]
MEFSGGATESTAQDRAGQTSRSPIADEACGTFTDDGWFEVQARVQPHHTDYAGVVWHGAYITWLETARVECLRALGVGYEELVRSGCDLPVVDLTLRYHRALRLGDRVSVRTRLEPVRGVRISWIYELSSPDRDQLYVTGRVTLVTVEREQGRIVRRLPVTLSEAIARLPT